MSAPRKIVFNMPSLVPDGGSARVPKRLGRGGEPASAIRQQAAAGEDARKLTMLIEVSQALTGTLNLQAGLYGVLEVLRVSLRSGARGDHAPGGGERAAGGGGGARLPAAVRDGCATGSARA